jgi:hypothetical protein
VSDQVGDHIVLTICIPVHAISRIWVSMQIIWVSLHVVLAVWVGVSVVLAACVLTHASRYVFTSFWLSGIHVRRRLTGWAMKNEWAMSGRSRRTHMPSLTSPYPYTPPPGTWVSAHAIRVVWYLRMSQVDLKGIRVGDRVVLVTN